jgi:hypothetical protein
MARTLETRPCPSSGIAGVPYRDENGVPVPKHVSIEVSAIVEDVEPANEVAD